MQLQDIKALKENLTRLKNSSRYTNKYQDQINEEIDDMLKTSGSISVFMKRFVKLLTYGKPRYTNIDKFDYIINFGKLLYVENIGYVTNLFSDRIGDRRLGWKIEYRINNMEDTKDILKKFIVHPNIIIPSFSDLGDADFYILKGSISIEMKYLPKVNKIYNSIINDNQFKSLKAMYLGDLDSRILCNQILDSRLSTVGTMKHFMSCVKGFGFSYDIRVLFGY